ncbi:MAG: DUF1285 domain-containing protein [Deltaproteobacteria bacterium]|nr:DUF1285 domain-containing protein [Deltaproteobacteria bacterium]
MRQKLDNIPNYGILIDKEGNWFYNGAEMFRKEILELFYAHLTRDDAGRYIIRINNDSSLIEVEDCAFVVKAFYLDKIDGLDSSYVLLSDGSQEEFVPESLKFSEDNVPYCKVKNGTFDARFSRSAYYQLAAAIAYDEDKQCYYLRVNDRIIHIK